MSQLIAACGIITVMIAAMAALTKALVWTGQKLRKLGHLADDLAGEPARNGRDAIPGVLERLAGIEAAVSPLLPRFAALEARVAAVEAQMHPNGGSTLRDAVDRLAPAETPVP